MSSTVDSPSGTHPHPAHAFLLAAMVPLFVGAAINDYAYTSSAQVQWLNFANWLIAGGLVFAGGALLCVVAGLVRGYRGHYVFDFVLLLALWILGFIDALVHARDAWASMPTGLVLSVVVAALACIAAWLGFSRLRVRGMP
ncbi:MAG TPA: DUF2231 domain-containing protein [Lysobacter sp.]|nr:DUF2231 domain-containing protein [Lysobacter sp.]